MEACKRSKRERDSSQLHTEAGVPRGVGPRSSGCSHSQSTPLSCATVTMCRHRRTISVPCCTFRLSSPFSQGKPSGQSALRRGAGPLPLAQGAREYVSHGGLRKTCVKSPFLTLLRRGSQVSSARRSCPRTKSNSSTATETEAALAKPCRAERRSPLRGIPANKYSSL